MLNTPTATTPTTATIAPAIAGRTGTALRPRPGSSAMTTPTVTGGAHPAPVAAFAAVDRSGRRAESPATRRAPPPRREPRETPHDQEHREEPGAEHEPVDIEPRARLGITRDAERHERRRQPGAQHAERRAPTATGASGSASAAIARTARDTEPAQRRDTALRPVHEPAERDRDDHDAGAAQPRPRTRRAPRSARRSTAAPPLRSPTAAAPGTRPAAPSRREQRSRLLHESARRRRVGDADEQHDRRERPDLVAVFGHELPGREEQRRRRCLRSKVARRTGDPDDADRHLGAHRARRRSPPSSDPRRSGPACSPGSRSCRPPRCHAAPAARHRDLVGTALVGQPPFEHAGHATVRPTDSSIGPPTPSDSPFTVAVSWRPRPIDTTPGKRAEPVQRRVVDRGDEHREVSRERLVLEASNAVDVRRAPASAASTTAPTTATSSVSTTTLDPAAPQLDRERRTSSPRITRSSARRRGGSGPRARREPCDDVGEQRSPRPRRRRGRTPARWGGR